MTDIESKLVEAAIRVRANAYAPYSKFKVGAVVRCADGTEFDGCNVENGVLGLSICAERVAITKAISAGKKEFRLIVVAASRRASPCGSCRQFMSEFNSEMTVLSVDANDPSKFKRWTVAELLPDRFELS